VRVATLRRPSRDTRGAPVAQTTELPAPVGGLNARDSIAQMDAIDAVALNNFVCGTTDVSLRDGYAEFATGLPGPVRTIMVYNQPNGTKQQFAASGSNIYETTVGGAVGAAVVTGLGSDRWQWINFSTSGGTFLFAVNGTDLALLYDGSTWTNPAITGVTTSTLVNVAVWKERIWLVQKDTLTAWYLAASSISGAATQFDFKAMFKKGGFLVAIANWSLDGGTGLDDYFVAITSEGEVAVYQGTDPASATTFARRGIFQVGNPIGYRCFEKYAGDVVLINRDGLVPLSKALVSDRVNSRFALTDKVNGAITTLTRNHGSMFGWQVQLYPQQNLLFLNVPVPSGSIQYVMNTITGSWSTFSGWDAYCFAKMGEDVYFGGAGFVAKIWGVQADAGDEITAECLQAFSKFGAPFLKHFKMVRPIFITNGQPQVSIAMNVDYRTTATYGGAFVSALTGGVWGVGLWGQAKWAKPQLNQNWQSPAAIGYTGALAMRVVSDAATFRWQATQHVFERAAGNVL
jgi:hypothetical protein